jgi:hypothetical protein
LRKNNNFDKWQKVLLASSPGLPCVWEKGECMTAKCVRIVCTCKPSKSFAEDVHKFATKLQLEGVYQIIDVDHVRIIASGVKDKIDLFIDVLYKLGSTMKPFAIEVEPFLKDKDYRGIFRIIQ